MFGSISISSRNVTTLSTIKRWQYICDHNFGNSQSIFVIFRTVVNRNNFLHMYEKLSTSPKYRT